MRKTFTFNGKRYEVTASNQKELDDRYFYKRLALEKEADNEGYTVSEWGEIWLKKYKEAVVNTKDYKLYLSRLTTHIYPAIGNIKLSKVTMSDCQLLMNTCSSYSSTYISKIYHTLKALFKSAVDEKLIEESPAEKIIKPKGKKIEERRSLTDDERKLVLKTFENNSHSLYFKMMLYCGLRPHECALIQGKDINGKELHVRGIKNENADRVVPIPDCLTLPNLKRDEYLFPNLSTQKRARWWNSFKRDMNINGGCKVYRNQIFPPFPVADDLTPYCFRHTYCTDLETAGVPLNIARQWMGHGSILITSKIYTHTSEKAWNQAVRSLNNSHTIPTACPENGL